MGTALLPFHIVAGLGGIATGAIALVALKGGRAHRRAGMWFVYAMLFMSSSGALIAALKPHGWGTALEGFFTFYLVASGLLAIRRRQDDSRRLDLVLLIVAVTLGVTYFTFGIEALRSQTGRKDGYPAMLFFIFGDGGLAGRFRGPESACPWHPWEAPARAPPVAHVACDVHRDGIAVPGSGEGVSEADPHHAAAVDSRAAGARRDALLAGAPAAQGVASSLQIQRTDNAADRSRHGVVSRWSFCAIGYSQRSARFLIEITRNCGMSLSVFTSSFLWVSPSTFVVVLTDMSPLGTSMPVTSTL